VAKKSFCARKKISSRLIKPGGFFSTPLFFEDLKSNLLGFFVNFLFSSSCTFMPSRLSGKKTFLGWCPHPTVQDTNAITTSLRGA
jgi:hypothetical protein